MLNWNAVWGLEIIFNALNQSVYRLGGGRTLPSGAPRKFFAERIVMEKGDEDVEL